MPWLIDVRANRKTDGLTDVREARSRAQRRRQGDRGTRRAATLLNLGTRIDPGEGDDLAAQLLEAIGVCLRHAWKAQRFPPNEFMRRVACVVPLGTEQGAHSVRAVFTVLREAVS
jgi:uncharacterized protein (DUF2267 family)